MKVKNNMVKIENNNEILSICSEFYNTHNILYKEYENEQKLKKGNIKKEEKLKHNEIAVKLNGMIQKNKFDFVDKIIKTYKSKNI